MRKLLAVMTIAGVSGFLLGYMGWQGVVIGLFWGSALGHWYANNFHPDGRFRMTRGGSL